MLWFRSVCVTVSSPSRYCYSVPWLTVGYRYTPLHNRPLALLTVLHRPSPFPIVSNRYGKSFFITNQMKLNILYNENLIRKILKFFWIYEKKFWPFFWVRVVKNGQIFFSSIHVNIGTIWKSSSNWVVVCIF